MQADKEETKSAAAPAAGKPPSISDRLQRAFHARPAFQPLRLRLRHLTVRHQDGGGDAKTSDAGAEPGRAPKHSGPPVPAPPQPRKPSPLTVRLPKAAAASAPPGPPVPVPPPDVTAGMVIRAADAKDGDKAQQAQAKSRVGFRVRKALSSK
ncbi:unnamed protein product [Urochloa decumbens]|uniref:Uncharacterized protein n=1 Tax=Urochloa decumbens TaxID=240449 RepID=A0ABC8WUE4_9POAL